MFAMQETLWTDYLFQITASAGSWLSLWGGLLGALSAVLMAIGFEEFLRQRERRKNREHVRRAIYGLHVALLPFMNETTLKGGGGITGYENDQAQKAARQARVSLQWARSRPELFSFADWTKIAVISDIFEVWAAWYAKNAGGLEPFYASSMDTMSVARLADNLRPHLDHV